MGSTGIRPRRNVTLGLTTTVDFIGRPLGPRPTISIERWHVGQCASIRGCGGTAGRLTGSAVLLADNQVCFLTGVLDLCHRLEQWEPDELRGSCPVLRAAAGEAPAADSTLAAHDGAWRVPVPLSHHGCLEPPHCRLARGGRESSDVAAALVTQACSDNSVDPRGLILHSDNGSPMRGSTMTSTLQWLGIVPSFSRPHVADDNPYSEALFRTMKHTPAYPHFPFADVVPAQRWVARFVSWYNGDHRHSGIKYVTPDERHYGLEEDVLAHRRELYERARRANPQRWSGPTRNWAPVEVVVLNPEPPSRQAAA